MRLIALGCGRVSSFLVFSQPERSLLWISSNNFIFAKIFLDRYKNLSSQNLKQDRRSLLEIVWIVVPLHVTREHLRGAKPKSWQYVVIITVRPPSGGDIYLYFCIDIWSHTKFNFIISPPSPRPPITILFVQCWWCRRLSDKKQSSLQNSLIW